MGALADSLSGSAGSGAALSKKTILYSQTLAAPVADITLTSIPAIANSVLHLEIRGFCTSVADQQIIFLELGTGGVLDTSDANYLRRRVYGASTGATSSSVLSDHIATRWISNLTKSTFDYPSTVTVQIPDYSVAGDWTTYNAIEHFGGNYWSLSSYSKGMMTSYWQNTAAVDTIKFSVLDASNFDTGTSIRIWIEEY